nr:hypothetical protein [Paenibacillus larvae]
MELEKWLLDMDNSVETEKDVFVKGLYFLKGYPRKVCYSKNQLKIKKDKLLYLKEQFNLLFGAEKNPRDLNTEELGHYLVLTKAIYREEAYICWLNKSLDLINIHRDSSNYTSKRGT